MFTLCYLFSVNRDEDLFGIIGGYARFIPIRSGVMMDVGNMDIGIGLEIR